MYPAGRHDDEPPICERVWFPGFPVARSCEGTGRMSAERSCGFPSPFVLSFPSPSLASLSVGEMSVPGLGALES